MLSLCEVVFLKMRRLLSETILCALVGMVAGVVDVGVWKFYIYLCMLHYHNATTTSLMSESDGCFLLSWNHLSVSFILMNKIPIDITTRVKNLLILFNLKQRL